jgi:hypothetical protein
MVTLDASYHSSLGEILEFVAEAGLDTHELANHNALRCLERVPNINALNIRQYHSGDQYVAISYTWPGAWTRLYSIANPSVMLRDGRPSASEHISVFMLMVLDDILAENSPRP